MVDPAVLKAIKKYLKAVRDHGFPDCFGIVFGSQVAGTEDPWSDIDLMLVSARFDGPRNREDTDLLWRLAAQTDSRIEPIPCGEKQWQHDTSSAIIEIARRSGEVVHSA